MLVILQSRKNYYFNQRMNNSNNNEGAEGWLSESAEILGFSSAKTLAVSAAFLFFSLLASAIVIVYCINVASRRHSKTTLGNVQYLYDSNCEAKTSLSTTPSLPTYEQCLQEGQAFWWDDESTVLVIDDESATQPPSFSSLEPKLSIK